jgi:hypothetical protein
LPEKRKKRSIVEITLAAAVFVDANGHTLLFPPPVNTGDRVSADDVPTLVSRMWHFPAISVTKDTASELQAYLRTFVRGARNGNLRLAPAGKARHTVTYRNITLLPFRVEVKKLPNVPGARRVSLAGVSTLAVSNLTRKVARAALATVAPASGKHRGFSPLFTRHAAKKPGE